MSLSDDLAKLDQFTELIMIKVYNYMANALEENDLHKLPEYTKVNNKVRSKAICCSKLYFSAFKTSFI